MAYPDEDLVRDAVGSCESTAGAAAKATRVAWERDLGPVRAFLPERVPLTRLPPPFQVYLDISRALPEHYPAKAGGSGDGWKRHCPSTATSCGPGSRSCPRMRRSG